MRDDLITDVEQALVKTYGLKKNGDWLQQGRCPKCGKKELWGNGFFVRCSRVNKCAYEAKTKDLFPDLFGKIAERYPATTEDPDATARAYMEVVRGLSSTTTKGWYRQGTWHHPHGNRTVATVVFDIDRDKGIWMERFVDPVKIVGEDEPRRANFQGPHRGRMWIPPGQTLKDNDELWLVEGCIDAVTLSLCGQKVGATLSSGNFPRDDLDKISRKVKLIWALDNDPAGRKAMRKQIPIAEDMGFACRAALIPQTNGKTDWNDAHIAGCLTPEQIENYRYHGDLFLAESVQDKAVLMFLRHHQKGFVLEFAEQTWWAEISPTALALAKETGLSEADAVRKVIALQKIANCSFRFLYFQQDALTDESWYYAHVKFPSGRIIKTTFTGAQIASASEFKKRLASATPGGLYTGTGRSLDKIIGTYADPGTLKIVETINYIGYSRDHQAWIFNTLAVANGTVIPINDEDFFEIGGQSVRSLNQSVLLRIGEPVAYRREWIDMMWQAFGPKGMIAVAFFLGSLFAEQIRSIQGSYPFLEIVGEPGSGKSTLIEFLWQLLGRDDYEGFDPNKATPAALSRILSQVSNLPVSLIESDREDASKTRQFDWDQLKTAYNGRASRARGIKNAGNDTYEPPFRGSILISQNNAVSASDAILQRIINLNFSCGRHSPHGKAAADALCSLPTEAVSAFILFVTMAEHAVLQIVRDRQPDYERSLLSTEGIHNIRIAKNHGQIMALVDALDHVLDLGQSRTADTMEAVRDIAVQRQRDIAADHPMVESFWDAVDYLSSIDESVNHARDSGVIAINLNHLHALSITKGQPLPQMDELKKQLRASRSRKFLSVKVVNSAILNRSVKCWVFAQPGKDHARH